MASLNLSPTQSADVASGLPTEKSTPLGFDEKFPVQELQGSMIESQVFKPKQGNTLSRRLLLTLMPTTLIPLVIAGYLGFQAEKQRAQQEALSLLKEESVLAARTASHFVEDGLKGQSVIAAAQIVKQALSESTEIIQSQGLENQDIGELESTFAEQKLLQLKPELNQYLADVAQVEGLGEISLTESKGFNVAYSQPTPDFVQKDERWWRTATSDAAGIHIGPPELDRTTNQMGVSLSRAIKGKEGKLLGVIKSLVRTQEMDEQIQGSIASSAVGASQAVQIVDARTGIPFNLIEPDGVSSGGGEIIGGANIASLALAMEEGLGQLDLSVEALQASIAQTTDVSALQLERLESPDGEEILTALADIGAKKYSLTTIPGTNWMAIASVDISEVESAGNEVIKVFGSTTAILSLAAAAVLLLLARQLSRPLISLTTTAQAATAGNLNVRATLQGTVETQTLGQTFNSLLNQIQGLLSQQEQAAAQQQKLREELEEDINLLMEDVSDAADGDLRVRAKLSEGDVGIIADLFNAIIENLRLTTLQVKSATGEVTSSLTVNEVAIRELAEQAIREAQSLQETMEAVEDISTSIQEVAVNAGQASRLTQDTFSTVQAGTESMDQTVGSILGLRSTVGETAKKIKRLGESAQKISQAVGLIDEIALKTNLLAVNASVEAARAGEMGQGFTAVAEQVGSLAEQSSAATKEIAQIVASIQNETQEVIESIETGTAQVVESTNLVAQTKQRLAEVLLKSEQINQLMQQISASTAYQTESSAVVTQLVKLATEESEQRSKSSLVMAQAIQETAKIAKALEVSVEQFKVDDEPGDASDVGRMIAEKSAPPVGPALVVDVLSEEVQSEDLSEVDSQAMESQVIESHAMDSLDLESHAVDSYAVDSLDLESQEIESQTAEAPELEELAVLKAEAASFELQPEVATQDEWIGETSHGISDEPAGELMGEDLGERVGEGIEVTETLTPLADEATSFGSQPEPVLDEETSDLTSDEVSDAVRDETRDVASKLAEELAQLEGETAFFAALPEVTPSDVDPREVDSSEAVSSDDWTGEDDGEETENLSQLEAEESRFESDVVLDDDAIDAVSGEVSDETIDAASKLAEELAQLEGETALFAALPEVTSSEMTSSEVTSSETESAEAFAHDPWNSEDSESTENLVQQEDETLSSALQPEVVSSEANIEQLDQPGENSIQLEDEAALINALSQAVQNLEASPELDPEASSESSPESGPEELDLIKQMALLEDNATSLWDLLPNSAPDEVIREDEAE